MIDTGWVQGPPLIISSYRKDDVDQWCWKPANIMHSLVTIILMYFYFFSVLLVWCLVVQWFYYSRDRHHNRIQHFVALNISFQLPTCGKSRQTYWKSMNGIIECNEVRLSYQPPYLLSSKTTSNAGMPLLHLWQTIQLNVMLQREGRWLCCIFLICVHYLKQMK